MDYGRYDVIFEDFIRRIVLTKTQRNKIENVLGRATEIFNDVEEVDYQGSFATGTTVKPLTEQQSKNNQAGEYDADIMIIDDDWGDDSSRALNAVENNLRSVYSEKVCPNKKESCERVVFADEQSTGVSFHADYVPLLYDKYRGLNRASRKDGNWHSSETKEIIRLFNEFANENKFASSCLIMLKRFRDYNNLESYIPSIFLQACTMKYYKDQGSYLGDLLNMVNGIEQVIADDGIPIYIKDENGRSLTEDLQNKIKRRSTIKGILASFKQLLIVKELNLDEMKDFLSDSFPTSIELYPLQMESLRYHEYAYDTANGLENYEIDIDESMSKYKFTRIQRYYAFSNEVKFEMKFKKRKELVRDVRKLQCRWRITNDLSASDVRGKLLKRESGNEFVRKETAMYDGSHRAEAFVIDNKKIVGYARFNIKRSV